MAIYNETDKTRWTKDGRHWYFMCYKKDFNGKNKKYKSKKYLKKAEAEEAERLFLMKKNSPTHQEFSLVAKDYFEELARKRKESTVYTLFRDYERHIKPYFANKEINEIGFQELRYWKETVEKQGYSLNYLNKLYSVFSEILNFAITNYGLENNKLKLLGRFQRKNDEIITNEKRIRYITLEQFNKFISYIDEPMWKAFFYFCFYTGARKGEIIALTWNDIDLEKKTIHINKTLYAKIKGKYGEKVSITNTKNAKNRDVKINKLLSDVLINYKEIVKKYQDFKESWFVFGNTTYLSSTQIDRIKDQAFEKSGIPRITMHEFRHSHVSLLINEYIKSGQTDTSKFFLMMSERMGHTIQVMQNTYMHLFPTVQDEIVDLLDNL